jgi:uncharacterized membrane protein
VIIMSDFTLIVFAHAIHVMAGVVWAGTTFLLAMAIMPLMLRHGAEGAGRWLGMAARRAGLFASISALLTVLSGIYLFATLHRHDHSASELVLKTGAAAALLALAVGLFVGRPAGQRLAQLHQAPQDGAAPSAEGVLQLAALQRRVIVSSRVAAGLLGVSVLAMAVFRYAAALG